MEEVTRIYLCGPTVYDEVHIGNLRSVVFFDLIIRAKRTLGHRVFYLQNITDIDDKIVAKAKEKQVSEEEIAGAATKSYLRVLKGFGVGLPDLLVPITQEIDTISKYVERLLKEGFAYESDSGVYFRVERFKDYGMVSNLNLEASTSTPKKKKNSVFFNSFSDKLKKQDFALWKFKTEGRVFEFGQKRGRPGWHTECAALIDKYFGAHCDIHGGGSDLVFPHHENENAQHFVLHNSPITKRWLHVGQLQSLGKKMSKSFGNTFLARSFLRKYGADFYRFLILTTKSSAPLSFTKELFLQTKTLLHKTKLLHNLYWVSRPSLPLEEVFLQNKEQLSPLLGAVWKGEFSSFNKQLHQLISQAHQNPQPALLLSLLFYKLGFKFARKRPSPKTKSLFRNWQRLVSERNYSLADKLRAELKKKEIV